MKCLVCTAIFYGKTILNYTEHLKTHDKISKFQCEHCDHIYDNLYDLKKHLSKTYKSEHLPKNFDVQNPINNVTPVQTIESDNTIPCNNDNMCINELVLNSNECDVVTNINNPNNINNSVETFKKELINDLLLLLSDVTIPKSKAIETYKTSIIRKKELIQLIKNCTNNSTSLDFIIIIDNMLQNVIFSEYTLIKFLKENKFWIDTKKILLAEETILLNNTKTKCNKYAIEYVGLANLFTMLLNNIELRNLFVNFYKYSHRNSDYIMHILESNLFQEILQQEKISNPNFDKTLYIPYSLYSDEFDPKNSLGSHGTSYAVGHVYIFIHCLPPEYASKLEYIFFIMSYFSGDKKQFGTNVIFKTLAKEITDIENCVFNIDHEEYNYVQFKFVNLMGDNKDLHDLLGFSGYFLADILCRFCVAPKTVRDSQTIEIDSFIRTPSQYEENLRDLNVKISGVSKTSPFHGVSKNFGVINNFFVDIMHDVILGAFKYDISYSLFELCCAKKNKVLSLDILNERIQSFDYGPNFRNKIDTITSDRLKSGNIKGSASELLNLITHLPIILESLNVDPENQFFKMIVSCKKILTLLLLKCVHKNFHVLLKHEISQHLNLFLNILLPLGYTLKYKHHLLVHYPRVLERIGPLIYFACFRGEACHLKYKKCAQSISNCQNLIHTFTTRNQFQFAAFLNKKTFNIPLYETFSYSDVIVSDFELKYCITFPFSSPSIKVYKKISYIGTIYAIDNIIFIPNDDSYGQIKDIIEDEKNYYFVYVHMNTIYLDYIDCYEVLNYISLYDIVKIDKQLFVTKPLNVFKVNGRTLFNAD